MKPSGHHKMAEDAGLPLMMEAFGADHRALGAFYLGNWIADFSQLVDPVAMESLSAAQGRKRLLDEFWSDDGWIKKPIAAFTEGVMDKFKQIYHDDELKRCEEPGFIPSSLYDLLMVPGKDLKTHEDLTRKLNAFIAPSLPELAVLAKLHDRRRRFPAGADIVHEGQSKRSAFILMQGWVCSYKLLPEGTRQIVDFQIPGDFLGLRSMLFRTSDHNIEPITEIEAFEISESDLTDTFGRAPRLATALLWAISRDEAMVVERLVNIGRAWQPCRF